MDLSKIDNDEVYEAKSAREFSDETMEALYELESNPQAYIEVCLKIRDKKGEIIPFELNKPQSILYTEYMRQRKAKQPVRIIILKARQMGFSTLVSGLFFQDTVFHKNTITGIIAHKADASTNIFNKNKLFYEMLPPILQVMRKASNAKELIFENPSPVPIEKRNSPGLRSKIMIETAVDKNAFRSDTVNNIHMSEIAFWPYAQDTYISAMQAVPSHYRSAIIIESTANGVGNFFYDLWQQAKRGESEFVPLFFPWFWEEEYRMPLPDDYKVTEEEEALKKEFGLDDKQIVWRRWCIQSNCGGDIELFKQEYPSTDTEAFLSSGRPVFDTNALEKAMREAKPPTKEGNLVEENGRIIFRTAYKGYLKIWEEPKDGKEYVIGADTAQGLENGDYSCAAVWERKGRKKVAQWHGHIATDLFGLELVKLARYYQSAWIIPEINGLGIATLNAIKNGGYHRIYRRRASKDRIENEPTDLLGFWSHTQTKGLMITCLGKQIRENATSIPDEGTLRECISFVHNAQGKMEAQSGCHDDMVIANALAVFLIDERPDIDKPKRVPREKIYGRVSSVTGY